MDLYNIDKTVTVPDEYATSTTTVQYYGAKEIFEGTVLPILTQHDNVSLIGEYEEAESYNKKYVLDIGYDYLAIGFVIQKQYIYPIVCKKSDINNLDYLQIIGGGNSNSVGATINGNATSKTATISSHKLRIISKNNKLNAFLGFISSSGTNNYIILDTDSLGNKYLCVNGAGKVYYDKDDYVTYNLDVSSGASSSVPLDEQSVFKRQIPIYKDGVIHGLTRNVYYISNASLNGGSALKLIDVEDTKYRQVDAATSSRLWYIDS
jgi:hypothetical protein